MAKAINISTDEMPVFLVDYLNYLETIKGKSKNTIRAYSYDLRLFFRFIKVHKKIVSVDMSDLSEFDNIIINDISPDILGDITLSDLYSVLIHLMLVQEKSLV